MNKAEVKKISKFMDMIIYNHELDDWDNIMNIVENIESIIDGKIEIHYSVNISWNYSPKKTGTFSKGAGGGGGETVKRTPFESIFGKFHQIHVYYGDKPTFKHKKNEYAKTKKEAVLLACYRWILWYNKTVLKQKK